MPTPKPLPPKPGETIVTASFGVFAHRRTAHVASEAAARRSEALRRFRIANELRGATRSLMAEPAGLRKGR